MANARTGNKIFIDSTGAVISGANQPVKIAYILFTPNSTHDELLLRETVNGDDCLYLRLDLAKDTRLFDFSRKPIVFNNGIYVQTLSSGPKAVLITTSAGD